MKKLGGLLIVVAVVVLMYFSGALKVNINFTTSETTKTVTLSAKDAKIKETQEKVDNKEISCEGVSEDVVVFWKSYEAFVDEYADFVENHDSQDLNAAIKATDYMTTALEFAADATSYDEEKMADVDAKFVSEVRERVEARLAQIAENA